MERGNKVGIMGKIFGNGEEEGRTAGYGIYASGRGKKDEMMKGKLECRTSSL